MRAPTAAAVIVSALLAGCTAEDPYPVRPGGPGTGTGTGGDAGPGDAPAPTELAGEVCVVLRYDAPEACPANILRRDVLVEEVLGQASTRSDDGGGFTVPTAGSEALLRIGAELDDGLVATYTRVAVTGAPVAAPVIDEILWQETLAALLELDSAGAILAYVIDGAGAPVTGAVVTLGATGARIYYDDGSGGWIPDDGLGTGPDGIALVVDAGPATVTATLGARTASRAIHTAPGAIGVVRITLPD